MTLTQKARKAVATGLAISTAMMGFAAFSLTASAAAHSNGCLVNSNGTVYLIEAGQKRGFTSGEVFTSHGYNFGQVVAANADDSSLSTGAIIVYADGSIVKGPNDPLVYLVANGQKRGFTSGSVFTGLGYSFANIQWAPVNTFNDLPTGANVESSTERHPAGTWVVDGTGTVWKMTANGRMGLPSMEVFNSYGKSWSTVVAANAADLAVPNEGVVTARAVCTSTPSEPNGPLEGGVGDITVSASSIHNNETVEEGESDVEVMSFKVEADDESDVRITSVRVELAITGGSASQDITDYLDEVSVMNDGDVLGSDDADDFNESSDIYTRSISLSGNGAIVRAGTTETFSVAVSALDNLDSSDIADADVAVDVTSIRFEDGDGVFTTTDAGFDSDELEKDFTFVAEGDGEDLSIKSSSDDVDASTFLVEEDDESDEYQVFGFRLEAEETDFDLEELVLNATVSTTTFDTVVSDVYIEIDGQEFNDYDVATGGSASTDLTFDLDGDFTLDADDTVEVAVFMTFRAQDGEYPEGTTIVVETVSVEGEGVDNVTDTTTVTGETHTLSLSVPVISDVTSDAEANDPNSSGVISFAFTVEAEDDDVVLDVVSNSDVDGSTDDIRFTVTGTDPSIATAALTLIDGDANYAGGEWTVAEGDEATFALDVTFTTGVGDDGVYRVRLDSVAGVTVDELSPSMNLAN